MTRKNRYLILLLAAVLVISGLVPLMLSLIHGNDCHTPQCSICRCVLDAAKQGFALTACLVLLSGISGVSARRGTPFPFSIREKESPVILKVCSLC